MLQGSGEAEGTELEDASDNEDDWSDDDDDDDVDDDEDYDDEWSDDDDVDFNDDQNEPLPGFELSQPTEQVNGTSKKSNDEVLAPVFPDGRPRENW